MRRVDHSLPVIYCDTKREESTLRIVSFVQPFVSVVVIKIVLSRFQLLSFSKNAPAAQRSRLVPLSYGAWTFSWHPAGSE